MATQQRDSPFQVCARGLVPSFKILDAPSADLSSPPAVVASPSQVCSCLLPVQPGGGRPAPSWATSGRVLQPCAARSAHRRLGLRLRGLYEVEQLAAQPVASPAGPEIPASLSPFPRSSGS